MIGRLASLSAQQRAVFQRMSSASASRESAPSSLVDTVRVDPQIRYRPPHEAVSFMADFDEQLGISNEMKAEKRALMAESSHTFFRASPALFYHDLKTTYSKASRLLDTPAPNVPIVGDLHFGNSGTFRGPEGKAVWGFNDFDQAAVGSPEYDLERLGVSLYVAGRSANLSARDSMRLVEKMGRAYLNHLGEEGPSYLTAEESEGPIRAIIEKAGSKSQHDFITKWTTDGGRKLKRDGKLVDPEKDRQKEITRELEDEFPDLKFLDLASKPHSGGSTRGLERYYSLVTSKDREDPWILETKVLLPSPVNNQDGDLKRADGKEFLDLWNKLGGVTDERHQTFKDNSLTFFTREREREKDSLDEIAGNLEPMADAMGRLLARAHSKSGVDLKGWVGSQEDKFLSKLIRFSRTYARQVESDYREWNSRYGTPPST